MQEHKQHAINHNHDDNRKRNAEQIAAAHELEQEAVVHFRAGNGIPICENIGGAAENRHRGQSCDKRSCLPISD